MSSSNGTNVKIDLPKEAFEKLEAGYSLPRIQFDYMMFQKSYRNSSRKWRECHTRILS